MICRIRVNCITFTGDLTIALEKSSPIIHLIFTFQEVYIKELIEMQLQHIAIFI